MFETLADIVPHFAATRPGRTAVRADGASWSFADLHDRERRAVTALKALGVRKGDRVGWLALNHIEYVTLMCACFRMGVVMVAINARLVAREIAYVLGDAGINVLVSETAFLPLVTEAQATTGLASVLLLDAPHDGRPAFADFVMGHAPDDVPIAAGPDDIAIQMYTSGTTGFPKGALLSHRQLLSALAKPDRLEGTALAPWQDDDVSLVAMPVFHVSGSLWLLMGMARGAPSVILPRPDIATIVTAIAQQRITRLVLVPAVMLAICQYLETAPADLSSVRELYYGASPIPLDVLRRSIVAFPRALFVQVYGATETSASVTWLPPEDHDPAGNDRMRSCGKPYPGDRIRIVDDHGNDLPPGAVGEILISSPGNMTGYHNKPEATAKALIDGWYHSGDAGYLDADGYLYIHDRVKDMIVSGAENIYPAEVENALHEHPAVADCAVIGVPDDKWGEAVKAIVVKKAEVTPEELIAFARARIAGYKVPKSVDFIDVLPRNPSGKILKKDLREPWWAGRERKVN
ncbi:long-chain-fatty-acid--CoA ligase [Sandarakinorhabdus rubra]|uniref:long-chain-fatty-acid--CoA ligase n=1 Tax=Sandarakinorhabdus rubra TaxID=2672568 RepID=UPI0013D8FF0B|nr:long-chain-fatty-acid--CoA ligase [Sandarakinorhabdus rubra]